MWCIRSIIKWYFNNTIRNLQRNSTICKSTLNITSTHSDHSSKKYTTHSNLLSQSKSITNKLKSHHHSLPNAPTRKFHPINRSKQI